jgi:hypothetical protein
MKKHERPENRVRGVAFCQVSSSQSWSNVLGPGCYSNNFLKDG